MLDTPAAKRMERDMRVFMAGLSRDIGQERAYGLANLVNDRAATYAGEVSSLAWFRAWQEVLTEVGTAEETEYAVHALSLVKKLWDAGF